MNSVNKIENKIMEFIERNKLVVFFIMITVITVVARFLLLKFQSRDYTIFLEKWFNELKQYGGVKALKRDIGNYNAPYLTIMAFLTYLPIKSLYSIKLVSIIFDYVLALGVAKIALIIFKDNKNKNIYSLILYGVVLMYPTVILNSACWGQADSIYTAFVVWAIAFLMQEKYLKSFVFLGLAFAFKLQFIFILPLYLLVYISNRKFSILGLLIIPLVNFIMCMPAIIFGKSISSCMRVYINQAGIDPNILSKNFPGIYNLILPIKNANYVYQPFNNIDKVGILLTIFIFVVLALIVMYKKIEFNNENIITFGLLSVLIATFFLPHMHDRYLYIGDILALVYLVFNNKKIYIPIGIELISLYTYGIFLFGYSGIPIQIISFMFLCILIVVVKDGIYTKYFCNKSFKQLKSGGKTIIK